MAKDPTTYAIAPAPSDPAPMAVAPQAPAAVRSGSHGGVPQAPAARDDTTTSAMKGYRKGGLVKKAAATNRYAKKRK